MVINRLMLFVAALTILSHGDTAPMDILAMGVVAVALVPAPAVELTPVIGGYPLLLGGGLVLTTSLFALLATLLGGIRLLVRGPGGLSIPLRICVLATILLVVLPLTLPLAFRSTKPAVALLPPKALAFGTLSTLISFGGARGTLGGLFASSGGLPFSDISLVALRQSMTARYQR